MYSYVIPFHKDYEKVLETADKILSSPYNESIEEIILAHNGKELSPNIIEKLKHLNSKCKYLHTDCAGIGAGYRLGLESSIGEYTILSASDLPFGFSDLNEFEKLITKPSLAIGSKWVQGSRIKGYGPIRKLSSFLFWALRATFLGLNTPRDSQGTIIVNTAFAKKILKLVEANNYFFSLELISYSLKSGESVLEVPVILENHSTESSVSLIKDGPQMIKDLVQFSTRIK